MAAAGCASASSSSSSARHRVAVLSFANKSGDLLDNKDGTVPKKALRIQTPKGTTWYLDMEHAGVDIQLGMQKCKQLSPDLQHRTLSYLLQRDAYYWSSVLTSTAHGADIAAYEVLLAHDIFLERVVGRRVGGECLFKTDGTQVSLISTRTGVNAFYKSIFLRFGVVIGEVADAEFSTDDVVLTDYDGNEIQLADGGKRRKAVAVSETHIAAVYADGIVRLMKRDGSFSKILPIRIATPDFGRCVFIDQWLLVEDRQASSRNLFDLQGDEIVLQRPVELQHELLLEIMVIPGGFFVRVGSIGCIFNVDGTFRAYLRDPAGQKLSCLLVKESALGIIVIGDMECVYLCSFQDGKALSFGNTVVSNIVIVSARILACCKQQLGQKTISVFGTPPPITYDTVTVYDIQGKEVGHVRDENGMDLAVNSSEVYNYLDRCILSMGTDHRLRLHSLDGAYIRCIVDKPIVRSVSVSVLSDGLVSFWDLHDKKHLYDQHGHEILFKTASEKVHADIKHIGVAGAVITTIHTDGALRIWRLPVFNWKRDCGVLTLDKLTFVLAAFKGLLQEGFAFECVGMKLEEWYDICSSIPRATQELLMGDSYKLAPQLVYPSRLFSYKKKLRNASFGDKTELLKLIEQDLVGLDAKVQDGACVYPELRANYLDLQECIQKELSQSIISKRKRGEE